MSITSLNATPNTYKDNGISQPEVAVLGELPPHLLGLLLVLVGNRQRISLKVRLG